MIDHAKLTHQPVYFLANSLKISGLESRVEWHVVSLHVGRLSFNLQTKKLKKNPLNTQPTTNTTDRILGVWLQYRYV